MPSFLRGLVASAISATRPRLFYYRANRSSRKSIEVFQTCDTVDIVDRRDGRTIRLSRANSFYIPDMIESFEYFFGSARPIVTRVRGRIRQVVDFSTPRLHYVAGFTDFPILCPSLTEPYMTTEQYLDFADLKEGHIALDLGSYSGLTSIAFSKAVGASGKVVALEPDPLNYPCVEENIDMHCRKSGLDNTVVLKAAAAASSGKLRLSSEGAMGSALVSIVGTYRGESIEVDCHSLADIVRIEKLPKVDFIKIDIEGAELDLITGSREFIAQYRPRMIIEPHFIEGQSTAGPVIACLEGLDYRCSVIEQQGLSLPLITAHPDGGGKA